MKSLLFCLLFTQFQVFAQCDTNEAVDFPDVEAQFPGGIVEMKKFIQENIEYPPIQDYQCHEFTGTIYITFFVCEDGSLNNIELMRSSNSQYDQIAIDLVEKMPNWIPAEDAGKKVTVRYRIPIKILLQ